MSCQVMLVETDVLVSWATLWRTQDLFRHRHLSVFGGWFTASTGGAFSGIRITHCHFLVVRET